MSDVERFTQKLTATLVLCASILYSSTPFALETPREEFPMDNYTQDVSAFIAPHNAAYKHALLTPSYQVAQLKQFYIHYFASDEQGLSPWSEAMVHAVQPYVQKTEANILASFNNQTQAPKDKHYAENYKEKDDAWWHSMEQNTNLEAFDAYTFNSQNRAIAVDNTAARALPDGAPDYFHYTQPGEGAPFDNLQVSTVWAGTPLYILHESRDKAWSLVLTPDAYIAWVKTKDIAHTSPQFVTQWQHAAQKQLLAITKTNTSIYDTQQNFQFSGYIGAVFPAAEENGGTQHAILIPVKNTQHEAIIQTGYVDEKAASAMPLKATPEHMAMLMKELQNRPYGWGGAFLLNDCSQEMKVLFTPLGFWLPRNSGMQAALDTTLDLSSYNVDERLEQLKTEGDPLMTIVYIGGHILLYVGQKEINGQSEAMTYQNIWGLSPRDRSTRFVIGKSVFIPMLKQYPENPALASPADKKYFKLLQMDKLTPKSMTPEAFAESFI